MVFIPERASTPIRVIEHNRHRSLCNPCLSLLVHELLKIRSPNLLQVRDSQNEANRIEDVRFAGTVQPRDGIEERIEAGNDGSRRVRLETFQANLLYVHSLMSRVEDKKSESEGTRKWKGMVQGFGDRNPKRQRFGWVLLCMVLKVAGCRECERGTRTI